MPERKLFKLDEDNSGGWLVALSKQALGGPNIALICSEKTAEGGSAAALAPNLCGKNAQKTGKSRFCLLQCTIRGRDAVAAGG